MKVLLSHPTGNSFVRSALTGLLESDILESFHTSVACIEGNSFNRLSKLNLFSELKRREYHVNLKDYTVMHPLNEIGRMCAGRLGLSFLTKHETGYFSIDAVYNDIDKRVGRYVSKKKCITSVYAYEDGAIQSFQAAKKLGIKCIYDLPIGYWRTARKLLSEERQNRPDWADTLTGFKDSIQKLEKKDKELALADHIFVASSFTAKTLLDYPGKLAPVSIIPYSFPPIFIDRQYETIQNRPLKLLFVGGLSQRKGIANVFEAVEAFGNDVSLTIVGHKASNDCTPLNNGLIKHTWIPSLPHAEILTLMREHDVLLFPSLFEGFGLVITEAMSQGTPVITTDRTCGLDLIQHDVNGWLVEAGSTKALVDQISLLLNKTDLIEKSGKAAIETAVKRSWVDYGRELAEAVQQIN